MSQYSDCSMCNKKPGLTFLLVGYEVCPETANAPRLGGRFKAPPIPLGAKAHYTLRLLPPGYVYLHNPANKHKPWQGYIVTQDGYYYPFEIGTNGPEPLRGNPSDVTPCKPNEHGATAQGITLPHAEDAGDVWFCFSHVEWTKETWRRFDANVDGCRDKVMRKFNVAKWLANPEQDHAALVSKMAGKIVEFSGAVKAKEFGFSANPVQRRDWSLQDWGTIAREIGAPAPADPMHPTQEEATAIAQKLGERRKAGMTSSKQDELFKNSKFGTWDILVGKFKRLCAGSPKTAGKGLVLALEDTVGVTSDVATLVSHASKRFAEQLIKEQPEMHRKLVTSQAIEGVRQMVCAKAIRFENFRMEQAETMRRFVAPECAPLNPDFINAFALPPDEYGAIAKITWKDYTQFYDVGEVEGFKQDYAKKLAAWNEAEIVSLSEAHEKWLSSTALVDAMQYHYDAANVESGHAYARTVALCLGSGQETAEARRVVEKWVGGEVTDVKNLYLRALVLNQDIAAAEVAQFAGKISGKPFYEQLGFWKDFLDNAFKVIERDLEKEDSVLQILLAQGSGVLMEAIQDAAYAANAAAGRLKHWAVVLGGISGNAVGFVRSTCSSAKGLLNFATNRIYDGLASTGSAWGGQGHRMIDTVFKHDMLGEGYMQSVQKGPSVETNIMVLVEKGKLKLKMAEAEIIQIFGRPVKWAAALSHKWPLHNIDRHLFTDRRNVGVASGLIGVYFGVAAAGSALRAYREGAKYHPELKTEFAENEFTARLGVSILGCVVALSETTSAILKRTISPTRLAQGLGFRLNTGLKLVGKGFGTVVSGIVAYRDAVGVGEAYGKGRGLFAASIALFLVDFAFFGVAMYSLTSYIISLIRHLRTGKDLAEASSIFMPGLEISLVSASLVLFMVGLLAISWHRQEKFKADLKEWLARSIFGYGKRKPKDGEEENKDEKRLPMYTSLAIEQSALKMVFQ